jgi:hypothetical protein
VTRTRPSSMELMAQNRCTNCARQLHSLNDEKPMCGRCILYFRERIRAKRLDERLQKVAAWSRAARGTATFVWRGRERIG